MTAAESEALRKERFIYLTTTGRKTGKPHTTELWFAIGRGGVYLSHEGDFTDWMKNVEKEPRVSAKIGKWKFEAKARIVKEGEQREEGKRALYEKYYGAASRETIDDWFSLSQVILLKPLSSPPG